MVSATVMVRRARQAGGASLARESGPTWGVRFEVMAHDGRRIRCGEAYWWKIVTEKHPGMAGYEAAVRNAIEEPGEIRRSRIDPRIVLYYGRVGKRYACAIVKHENGTGFLVTAYMTDAIKEGEAL